MPTPTVTRPCRQEVSCALTSSVALCAGFARLSVPAASWCKECHVSEKGEPILDSRTRWNSTYAMVKRALELREPLSHMMRAAEHSYELSHEEWVLLEWSRLDRWAIIPSELACVCFFPMCFCSLADGFSGSNMWLFFMDGWPRLLHALGSSIHAS
jgi:hypothetical protein